VDIHTLSSIPVACRLIGARRPDAVAAFFCLMMAFGLYGLLIPSGMFNAVGDFSPAVSYALNFKLALADGQWLPRWVIVTREYTFGGGGIDGTIPTEDSPAFLYYGFLESALALPFLIAGVSALVATQAAVCASFALGAWVLYRAGREAGAGPVAGLVGAYSYLVSPWLLSNFYHRGGIAEAMAQAGLPFLLLGFVRVSANRPRSAILTIALGIGWLALSHNIFLMHGTVLCVLFVIGHAIATALEPPLLLPSRTVWRCCRGAALVGSGIALGLCLTAWQWLPAWLTLDEIMFHYNGTFMKGGIGGFADWSGVFGVPSRFSGAAAGGGTTDFFMTIGWWVLPAILCLPFPRTIRPLRWALLLCFAWNFLLAYYPGTVTGLLPEAFGATQFSFRLLGFLSLLGALAVCLCRPGLSPLAGLGVAALMTASQLVVLGYAMPPQRQTDEAYLRGYEYNNYYANSPHEKNLRYWHNGWMSNAAIISFGHADTGAAFLRVQGTVWPALGRTHLYLAPPDDPDRPVSNVAEVEGSFDVTLELEHGEGDLRLVASPAFDPESGLTASARFFGRTGAPYSIRPERVSLTREPRSSYVLAERVAAHGYHREFRCPAAPGAGRSPDAAGLYTVELPMIYNRFSVPSQNGVRVPYESDFNHRILVRVPSCADPISVTFSLPWTVPALTGLGLCGALLVGGLAPARFRRSRRWWVPVRL